MARLNEPSSPTESIDSLKRKFMRQNRDIARANSAQSLRIRNLENETSRLLAENLGLREQILQLQNDKYNGKAQRIVENTGFIKTELEAKLLEISALIRGLGDGSTPKRKSPRERHATRTSPTKSPSQQKFKNICTLSEAVAGQEGRLPPILENKSYPRRTLEQQELEKLIEKTSVDGTDSPEIGPPPVSQFVDADPVKIDIPSRPKINEREELSAFDPALSVSIEQRRKRRDSSISSNSRHSSKLEPTLVTKDVTGSLKTGAKRKLSAREDDEEQLVVVKPAENPTDDFKFTRIASEGGTKPTPAPHSDRKAARELAVTRGVPREKQLASAAISSRKVLAPKSVNNSPRKSSRAPIHDELKVEKGEISKPYPAKERAPEKKRDSVSIHPTQAEAPLQTVEVQPEPETPAALDLFSPSSSQPSTARNESRDTPPPPDINSGTEGQRPSRRARPAVSYAEPNLRDKMRRPTKELVDAVVPGTSSLRPSTMKSENNDLTSVRVKSEPEVDDAWKQMPSASSATVENSPLSGKVAVPDALPGNITTHRKRRESMLAKNDVAWTGSASAVSALLAGTKRNRLEEDPLENDSAPSKPLTTQDIYDSKGSSPTPAESVVELAEEVKPVSRFSRRHSFIPRDLPSVRDRETSELEVSRKSDLSKSQRRQSTLGLRSSSSGTEASKEDEADLILKRSSSAIGLLDSGSSAARNERISARRRSMMT